MLPAEPLGARRGAHLLVGGRDHQELAGPRAPALAAERGGRRDLGGDLVLHVLGAATPDLAVHDVARPGVEAPLGRIGRNRVHVAEQAQGRSRLRRPQTGDQVGPARLGGQQLALEAGVGQRLGEQLLCRLLVARRVGGVDPDQPLQQLDGLACPARPVATAASSSTRGRLLAARTRRARVILGRRIAWSACSDTGRSQASGPAVPPAEAPLPVRMRPRSLEELVGEGAQRQAGP